MGGGLALDVPVVGGLFTPPPAMGPTLYVPEPLAVIPFPASTWSITAKSVMPANDRITREKVGKIEMGFMVVSCICLPMVRLYLSRTGGASPPSAAGSEDWPFCAGARRRIPGPAGRYARHALALRRRIRDPFAGGGRAVVALLRRVRDSRTGGLAG